MALLGVAGTIDIGPWHGWEITNTAKRRPPADRQTVGNVVVCVDGGVLTLAKGARRTLVTNIRAAISQLHFGEGLVSLVLPPMLASEGAFLHFPDNRPENILDVLIDR
jgi:hypothetical protein